jgi:hypothetical protein
VAEPFTTDLVIARSSEEGLRIQQDPNFPPPTTNSAIRLRNPDDNADLARLEYSGSLLTKQGNRATPWIYETELALGTATTINSTASTTLISVSVTPASACRFLISGTFDVDGGGFVVGSVFVGELNFAGGAQAAQAIFAGTSRQTVLQTWTPSRAANQSTTIQLTARVNIPGSTFTVSAVHTKLSILAIGEF